MNLHECEGFWGFGARRGQIVIDGSNVMYWKGKNPQIEPVRDVLRRLNSRGFEAGVMFDANAGYLVADRYLRHQDFGELLNLPEDRVLVAPKGSPADGYILTAARDLGARIVSNDRYRDWIDDHPEIRKPGYLIRGGYRSGELWLDLEPDREAGSSTARPSFKRRKS